MRGEEELQTINLLLEESRAHRFRDPERVVYFAELARAAADRLSPSVHATEVVADTRAMVWAELGNSYRLAEDFSRAQQAFELAVSWFERGSGHADLLVTISSRFATLLWYRRRTEEALLLLDRLAAFQLSRGERHGAGRALLKQGLYTEDAGEPKAAIRLTLRGLSLIDPKEEPALLLSAIHNLLWCASSLGRYELIERLLPKVRPLYGDDRLNVLRLTWIEARVAAGLGRERDAERLYAAARAGFLAAGLIFPASLVSLELALLWFSQGRRDEAAELAGELAASFSGLKVGREIIISLLLLRRAIEEGQLTELLESRVRSIAEGIRTLTR